MTRREASLYDRSFFDPTEADAFLFDLIADRHLMPRRRGGRWVSSCEILKAAVQNKLAGTTLLSRAEQWCKAGALEGGRPRGGIEGKRYRAKGAMVAAIRHALKVIRDGGLEDMRGKKGHHRQEGYGCVVLPDEHGWTPIQYMHPNFLPYKIPTRFGLRITRKGRLTMKALGRPKRSEIPEFIERFRRGEEPSYSAKGWYWFPGNATNDAGYLYDNGLVVRIRPTSAAWTSRIVDRWRLVGSAKEDPWFHYPTPTGRTAGLRMKDPPSSFFSALPDLNRAMRRFKRPNFRFLGRSRVLITPSCSPPNRGPRVTPPRPSVPRRPR